MLGFSLQMIKVQRLRVVWYFELIAASSAWPTIDEWLESLGGNVSQSTCHHIQKTDLPKNMHGTDTEIPPPGLNIWVRFLRTLGSGTATAQHHNANNCM